MRLALGRDASELGKLGAPGSDMSSTGTTISQIELLLAPASTILHSRLGPTRNFAIRSSGRWVAESPIRWTGGPSLPWSPSSGTSARASPATAPGGSPASIGDRVDLIDDHGLGRGEDLADPRGEHQVERLGGRDQDVGRRFLHRPPLGLGRVPGAQPDRDVGADPRQRRPQVALDVVGERLQRRDVDEPHPGLALGVARERSIPQRKLASVLPEPVGAQIRVLSPSAIASQPPAWAGVGPSKEDSNQRLTGALNGASGSVSALVFGSVVNPPILRRTCARPVSLRAGDAAGELHEGLPRGLRRRSRGRRGRSRRRSCRPRGGRRPRTRRPA